VKSALIILLFVLFPTAALPAGPDGITVGGEISGGFRRLADETADLATTPFQLENGNILITLGVGGAVALTYAYDQEIRDRMRPGSKKGLKKAADAGAIVGDPFIHLGVAALVYGGAIMAESPKWKEVGEMMGEALILADASTFLIKEATGRGRPSATNAKGDFKPFGFRNDYDSFPSLHTSSSFALASVLAATEESMILKVGYYGAATAVGLSRMYQNKHWASDVLLGAALGELCGRVVTSYHAGRGQVALAPVTLDRGAGMAMVGTW